MQMPLSEVKQVKGHKLIDQANLKRKRVGGAVPCTKPLIPWEKGWNILKLIHLISLCLF